MTTAPTKINISWPNKGWNDEAWIRVCCVRYLIRRAGHLRLFSRDARRKTDQKLKKDAKGLVASSANSRYIEEEENVASKLTVKLY